MEYDDKKPLKTTISLTPLVMKRVDEYACKLGINRSATIAVLVNQAFDYQDQVKQVAEFNKNFASYEEELKKVVKGITKGDEIKK